MLSVSHHPAPGRASDETDARLLSQAADGDTVAFAALARRFERPLRSYLTRLVRCPGLAEELTQDTLLGAWRGAKGFDGRARVSTWMFAIAHRKAASALRRRRLPTIPLDDTAEHTACTHDPLDAVHADDLRTALASLAPTHRTVLELTFTFGFDYREIAEILDIPVGTVKSRASSARHRLREALQHAGWEQRP